MKKIVICLSGASGSIYAKELIEYFCLQNDVEIYCVASEKALLIFKEEIGEDFLVFTKKLSKKISVFDERNFNSPIASGSFKFDAIAIVPCSMKTLGKIANGIASNLICRASDVALKERRRLVIVPRETPLALTHLKNMCSIVEAGGIILPPCPAFYNKEKTLEDAIKFIVARIVMCMGFEQRLIPEWPSND